MGLKERVRRRIRHLGHEAGERRDETLEWGFQRLVASTRLVPLNRYQLAFCEWNAQRLGITPAESRARFEESARTLRGGHGGLAFRTFNDISHSLYAVFANDGEHEVVDAYRLHTPAHFLRQLSHDEPSWSRSHPVMQALASRDEATIVDFGCGMAQTSISLADALRDAGCTPALAFADIPTMRLEFLAWLGKHWDHDAQTYACTPDDPVPALPHCDVLIAREFFEHVYDPVAYLDALDPYVKPGGFLLTNVADHHSEFMHVSPDLATLRARLVELGYRDVNKHKVLQKQA